MSSLSQSQSTLVARRKNDVQPSKGNVATKKRSKLDTDDGSPQKGTLQKRGGANQELHTKLPGRGMPTLIPTMMPIMTMKRR